MNKIQKLKLSFEERSRINRAAALKSVEKRRANGGFTHRGKGHPGCPGIPHKHVGIYTSDFIILHRYAAKTGKYKIDIMHELIGSLKRKLGDDDRLDEWTKHLIREDEMRKGNKTTDDSNDYQSTNQIEKY